MSREQSTDSRPQWFTSSYSGSDGGDCVEVAAAPEAVRVRDSKDRQGAQLRISSPGWSAFVAYAARSVRTRA